MSSERQGVFPYASLAGLTARTILTDVKAVYADEAADILRGATAASEGTSGQGPDPIAKDYGFAFLSE